MAKSYAAVGTTDDLACIFVSEFEEGAFVWVAASQNHFTLRHNKPGALPGGSIRPFDGSPVAGSPNAAWLPFPTPI